MIRLGHFFFSDQIEAYLPPKKGKKNILRIIREIIQIEPKGKSTSIARVLEYLNKVQKKKAIVFLLSDFISPVFETELSITSRKHDLIGIYIYDKRESNLPNVGIIRLRDLESNNTKLVDTSVKSLREDYADNWNQRQLELKTQFNKHSIDLVDIKVEEDYVKALLALFRKRV
jgi:uncharacterized protein (DUF58 family)